MRSAVETDYYTEAEAPPPVEEGLFNPELHLVPPPDVTPATPKAPAPEKSESQAISLRTYQKNATASVLRDFKGDKANGIDPVKRALVVMATGTGKAVVAAEMVRRAQINDHPTLVMVHRKELVNQLSEKINRFGIPVLKERAEESALEGFGPAPYGISNVVVASTATLRGDRLKRWEPDAFKLIIADEAHHIVSPGQLSILEHFGVMSGRTRLAGYTATPDRLDGVGLAKVFEKVSFEYSLEDALNDPEGPYLAKPVACMIETDPPIDLKDLRLVGDDFNQGDLERAINDNIGTLVNALIDSDYLLGKKFICFTPDVKSAHAVALALGDVGIKAKAVDGTTAAEDRERIIEEYKNGEIQGMVNCMIFTEGFDAPDTQAVVILRPTKSRALYAQMVGRATRPKAGDNICYVIDFTYNTGKHKLVSPVDLYDTENTPDAVVDMAREMVERGEVSDPKEAIDKAQELFDTEERVRIERKVAKLRVKTFDMVTAHEILGIKSKNTWGDARPATDKMIAYANKCGVGLQEGAGFGSTKKVLDAISMRRKYGLATLKQVACCMRISQQKQMNLRHEDIRKMTFAEASAFITDHKTW